MHALSIPTWVIHISSVIEWIAAIVLIWQFATVTQRPAWRALSWGMLPALISAMCACTWHFFDNAVQLDWLVTLQAATTLIGNCTMMAAAWWIWKNATPSTQG
ncbi:DUF2499 domain-containing protein [filamentous cyanobacterium LEGE 11480]|uniref:DUF2499 domain-containing protein n=1 Tax=Romeriopsis navalis LEGE 11480 TaxID=2777977 RepID=A0A928VPZ8_9CYAN|nr:DUF2499 domain-containing protein [Romeriopsis navalis]MBE9029964.1 DUF2499 domain-containing protein [Romeriopsis navalis LEGE 11480]